MKTKTEFYKDVHVIGEMDNSDGTFQSANRVYSVYGCCPTIPTGSGGGHIPKFLVKCDEERNSKDKTGN